MQNHTSPKIKQKDWCSKGATMLIEINVLGTLMLKMCRIQAGNVLQHPCWSSWHMLTNRCGHKAACTCLQLEHMCRADRSHVPLCDTQIHISGMFPYIIQQTADSTLFAHLILTATQPHTRVFKITACDLRKSKGNVEDLLNVFFMYKNTCWRCVLNQTSQRTRRQ